MSKIIAAPNSVLSQQARPYSFKDNSLPKLLKDMEEALLSATDPKGVGLAAPQIGKSISVFITKPSDKSKVKVFVNPKIIEVDEKLNELKSASGGKKKGKKEKRLEGCLSLPNIWGEVKRAPIVTLEYSNENGKKHTRVFTGFMATIAQHEVDHLNGVLFPKHVLEQKGKLYKSHKNKKGEDEFEELII